MSLEFWSKFTEKLESKLTQEEFNTWVRPLKGNLNDKTLEITAPNDFVLNYVMQNLSDEITNTVNKEIKGNISLIYKTLDKETFVDKYQSKQTKPQTKLVESYIFDSFVEGPQPNRYSLQRRVLFFRPLHFLCFRIFALQPIVL